VEKIVDESKKKSKYEDLPYMQGSGIEIPKNIKEDLYLLHKRFDNFEIENTSNIFKTEKLIK